MSLGPYRREPTVWFLSFINMESNYIVDGKDIIVINYEVIHKLFARPIATSIFV